jgi:hypothetical protein
MDEHVKQDEFGPSTKWMIYMYTYNTYLVKPRDWSIDI